MGEGRAMVASMVVLGTSLLFVFAFFRRLCFFVSFVVFVFVFLLFRWWFCNSVLF